MGAAVFRINGYIDDKIAEIPRVQLTTAAASGTSTNFLIIGSDSRSFVQSEADQEAFTDRDTTPDGPPRSDTMMVLHADGDASYVVSFPRDLMVNVPGLLRHSGVADAALAAALIHHFDRFLTLGIFAGLVTLAWQDA